MTTLGCPICRRSGYLTRDGLAYHFEHDHGHEVVAQYLARATLRLATGEEAGKPACPSRKVRFASEAEARTELVGTVVARNRGKNQRRECRVYQCSSCDGWHLTSQPVPAALLDQGSAAR
jgi:hypothetical protein